MKTNDTMLEYAHNGSDSNCKITKKVVDVNDIVLNRKNPRFIKDARYKKLKESIKALPSMLDVRPMVVDENMVILGGNMRFRAAKELGFEELPVEIVEGWNQRQKDEFTLKDNVSYGEWDYDVVANEWDEELVKSIGMIYDDPENVEESDFEQRFNAIKDEDALYPIVPKFDEKNEVFIIVCKNNIDSNWLRETLGMQKMKSYKYGELSKSNIISFEDVREALQNSNPVA